MRWVVHKEKPLYQDQWLDIRAADVELPDGRHLDHRVIRTAPGAGAVVVNDRHEVLLLWRHRFITDTWGYEIPAGKINAGEPPIEAAAREVEEETGWRPGPLHLLVVVQPSNGLTDSRHHIFLADGGTYVGPPREGFESERVEWIPLSKIRALIADGRIVGGTTLAALLVCIVDLHLEAA